MNRSRELSIPGRSGALIPNVVPYRALVTASIYSMVAVGNDSQFGMLHEVVGPRLERRSQVRDQR
jgi:hypothetical protein